MIGQYLSNTNENATVLIFQNFLELRLLRWTAQAHTGSPAQAHRSPAPSLITSVSAALPSRQANPRPHAQGTEPVCVPFRFCPFPVPAETAAVRCVIHSYLDAEAHVPGTYRHVLPFWDALPAVLLVDEPGRSFYPSFFYILFLLIRVISPCCSSRLHFARNTISHSCTGHPWTAIKIKFFRTYFVHPKL